MYVEATFSSITYSTNYICIIWSRLTKATKKERDLLAACHIALVTTARQDEEGEEERRREEEGLGSKATF